MAEFSLDCFLESGNAYKAALMLELCHADWEVRRVAFFSGETRGDAYRERNVMGEAPVMVHHRADGDFTLSQSGAILEYLVDRFGKFGPETEREKYEILRWILWDNHKLTSYTASARFMRIFMKKPADDPVVEFLTARARSAWSVLERQLSGHAFVTGTNPTIADFSLCGYLFWPDQIGMDQSHYPNIAAWLERIAALPGFKRPEELMPSGIDPTPTTA